MEQSSRRTVLLLFFLFLLSSKNAGSFIVQNVRFGGQRTNDRIRHRLESAVLHAAASANDGGGRPDDASDSKSKRQSKKTNLKRDIAKRLTMSKENDEARATLAKPIRNHKVKGATSSKRRSSPKASNAKRSGKGKVKKRVVRKKTVAKKKQQPKAKAAKRSVAQSTSAKQQLARKKRSIKTPTSSAASVDRVKSTASRRRLALAAKRRRKRRGGGGSLGLVFNETLKRYNENTNSKSSTIYSSILPPPLPRPTKKGAKPQNKQISGLTSWEEFMRSRSLAVNTTNIRTDHSSSPVGASATGGGSPSATPLPSIAELFPKGSKSKATLADTSTGTEDEAAATSSSSSGVLKGVLPVSELFYRAPDAAAPAKSSAKQPKAKKKKKRKRKQNNRKGAIRGANNTSLVRSGLGLIVNGKLIRMDPARRVLDLTYKSGDKISHEEDRWAKAIALNTNVFGPLLYGPTVDVVSNLERGLYCEQFVSNALKWNICPKDLSDLVKEQDRNRNAAYASLLSSTFSRPAKAEEEQVPDFPPDFGDFIESLNDINFEGAEGTATIEGEESDADIGEDEEDEETTEEEEETIDDTDDFEGEEGANVNLIFSEVENLILKEKRMEEQQNLMEQQQDITDPKVVANAISRDPQQSPYKGVLGPRMLDAVVERAKQNHPRVIAIGDVHGCIDELQDLLRACDYRPGDLVVFLGDLVCKGPDSTSVVQMAREIGAIGIRGNHDSEVIRWALAMQMGAYPPVVGREHFHIASSLTPEDTQWLKSLPWYIRSDQLNALFVHAGFVSGVKLAKQNPRMMMNMRSILPDGTVTSKFFSNWPWARLWDGPQTVLFGHDADRGLQQYEHAIGLDTGCVYGGRLTACILPEKRLVSVSARREYFKSRRKRYP